MSSPQPNRPQFSSNRAAGLDRTLGYAKVFVAEDPEISRRLDAWARDGYPASTMGGYGGGPSIIADGERVPVTSVEMAALFSSDSIADMRLRWNSLSAEFLGIAVQMFAIREFVMADTDEAKKVKKRQNTLPDCANAHGCPDEAFSDNDRGRCGTCANYLRKHGRDRTARYSREAS